ncbi:hypothetical protein D9M68_963140 [compost metagenome]
MLAWQARVPDDHALAALLHRCNANGIDFLHEMVVRANKEKIAAAQAPRAQTVRWQMESENYKRAHPNPW